MKTEINNLAIYLSRNSSYKAAGSICFHNVDSCQSISFIRIFMGSVIQPSDTFEPRSVLAWNVQWTYQSRSQATDAMLWAIRNVGTSPSLSWAPVWRRVDGFVGHYGCRSRWTVLPFSREWWTTIARRKRVDLLAFLSSVNFSQSLLALLSLWWVRLW